MGFRLENLGTWSPEREFKVTAEHTKRYAAATNDAIAAHVEGELAPPLFAVVPQNFVTGGKDPDLVIDLSAEEGMRVLHGEQDIFFHKPIEPGMVLQLKSATVGVHAKSTGTAAVLRFETSDGDDEPVNTQYMTLFFRGVSTGASAGEAAPPRDLPAHVLDGPPLLTVRQRFDSDQTQRYAEASGDFMPIHLDDAVARSVGLPGVIIHGLCTMAFASHALINGVADGDPRRLRRFAVRFSAVALPGQEMTTAVHAAGSRADRAVYAFTTINEAGASLLTNGIAEFAK